MFEQLFSTSFGGTAVGGLAVVNVQLTDFLQPLIGALITLAGLAAGFFVVIAGLEYMTSRGNPKRLDHAKRTLKNAALGLLLVIAAAFIFNFLNTAYNTAAPIGQSIAPPIIEVSEPPPEGLAGKILTTSSDFLRHIIISTFDPFINLIRYLSFQTPLAGSNEGRYQALVGSTWHRQQPFHTCHSPAGLALDECFDIWFRRTQLPPAAAQARSYILNNEFVTVFNRHNYQHL